MLPLSLGQTSAVRPERNALQPSVPWLRPANITAASRGALRALMLWLTVVAALGVSIALGYVWLRLKVVDVGYRLSATRQLIGRLEQEGHELTLQAAQLDAPGRLAEQAHLRVGMKRPDKGQEAVLP